MTILTYAVAVLLLVSIVLYIKAALFDRRPQKMGLLVAILAVPLYLTYYADHLPFGDWHLRPGDKGGFPTRVLVTPLEHIGPPADIAFHSDITPALIIALVVLVHMTVFQRVAVRRRLQRIHDPIATFFAGVIFITLIGGTIVSAYRWGWIGAVVVGALATLVYLGALALLAALVELIVAISKLFAVWIKRKVFAIATMITRIASWISSLGGRLVSRGLLEKIREDTANQERIFTSEQDIQDRRLEDAYVRDRRRAAQRRGKAPEQLLGPDPEHPAAAEPRVPHPAPATEAAVEPPAESAEPGEPAPTTA